MLDRFLREINYARISLTDKCNLRCRYCMPAEGVPPKNHHDLLTLEEMEKVVDSLLELGIKKVRITGGEPLIRKDALHFISALGKKPIKDLSLTTNGTQLVQYAAALKDAGVKNINISLDTLDRAKYRALTLTDGLESVIAGIEKACETGFDKLKLNVVLIRGINENETGNFIAFAKRYDMELRFIELMPFCSQKEYAVKNFVAAAEILEKYPDWQYVGARECSVAEYYDTGEGLVGFIKPLSDKFCARCNRVRITAEGYLLPCLHSSSGGWLKPYIDKDLTSVIAGFIKQKPHAHSLETGCLQSMGMNRIGG